jgi:hypothetical protein
MTTLSSQIACAVFIMCAAPRICFAQMVCSDVGAQIASANELRTAGRDEEAFLLLAALHGRCSTREVAAQLALTELRLGRWLNAHERLATVLDAIDDVWVVRHRATLVLARDAALEHLATFEPRSVIEGVELWIDGHHVGSLPLSRPRVLTVGTHEIELRRGGASRRHTIMFHVHEQYNDDVTALVPSPLHPTTFHNETTGGTSVVPPPLSHVFATRARAHRTAATGLLVTGGVLVTAAVGTWIASAQWATEARNDRAWQTFRPAYDSIESACHGASTSADLGAARVRELCEANEVYRPLAITLSVVGALSLTAGLITWMASPSSNPRVGVRVIPMVDITSRGVAIEGNF